MFLIAFRINWQRKKEGSSRHLFLKHGKLFGTKYWEIEGIWYSIPDPLIGITIDLRWKGEDHAGPKLFLDLFGLYLGFQTYDNRHWDYDEGDWEKPQIPDIN